MSYQVLARKWRPQTFLELVGQQHVVDAISNALENDKLHHAYLFTGTRGVGKTTIARIFSKSLNCETGQSANPCGKCDTCLDISDGRFVDLLEIDAASRTKVEDTRELLDNVQYKPTRGKYKVYLIDEVHMLSKHSFNALLKTLEEPPPHVKFLLATTDPQKLPVTILSRCLQFSLKALSREQIQNQLATVLEAEKLDFDKSALAQIARAAAGSMRDALSLTDQAIAQGNNHVSVDVVVKMLGLLDKNQILRLAKCICERDAVGAMAQLNEICSDSPDYSQILQQLSALLHQIALTQIVPDICKLDTNVAKPIYSLSLALSAEHVQLLYQIALNGQRDLPHAPDPLTGLQMTIMRMLAFTPAQNMPLAINDLKSSVQSAASAEAVPREEQQQTLNEAPNEEGEIPLEAYAQSDAQTYEQEEQPISDGFNPTSNAEPEDNVAHLQSLIDMEQDLASYEQEALGGGQGKKSDTESSYLRDDRSQHTEENGTTEHDQASSINNEQTESFDSPSIAGESEAGEPFVQDIGVEEIDSEPVNAEDSPKKTVEKTQVIEGKLEITPFLSDGSKLLKASQIDKWSAFVDNLDVRGLARQLLIHGRSTGIKDQCLMLTLSKSHKHLSELSTVQNVKDALKAKFSREIDVDVEYAEVSSSPYQIQQKIDKMRLDHAKETVNTDPSIQELVKAFDAQIIPDSIVPR